MITFNPDSRIYLCKTELEKDYRNQIDFDSLQSQTTYFNSKIVKSYLDYTYVRKDNVITVEDNIDNIINCNYLFYKNGASGKTYYCFIDNMQYISDYVTNIYIKTDVIQTYLFDMDFTKNSFIEREHVDDDTLGLHTEPEGLNTGEYFEAESYDTSSVYTKCFVIALDDRGIIEDQGWTVSTTNENVPNGLCYVAFDNITGLKNFVDVLTAGFTPLSKTYTAEDIYAVFIAYKDQFKTWLTPQQTTLGSGVGLNPDFLNYNKLDDIPYPNNNIVYMGSEFDTYTFKNNKLKCYPYQFLQVNNYAGEIVDYHYEDFDPLSIARKSSGGNLRDYLQFSFHRTLTIGGSGKVMPIGYKIYHNDSASAELNKSYPVSAQKLAIGSWVTDSYVNWQTQNSINMFGNTIDPTTWGYIKGVAKASKGALDLGMNKTDKGASGLSNGFNQIFDTMQRDYQAQLLPNNIGGNAGNGDINSASGLTGFKFSRMCIRPEWAKRIDNYFEMYGYKVNEFKPINIHKRTYWDYIKTIDCNIEGDIPQEYLQEIKNIFNNGLTFWHNTSYFLDYSQSNTIIS